MNKRLHPFLLGVLLSLTPLIVQAELTQATPLTVVIQNNQLVTDGQVTLGITPTMESALLHGIAIEYDVTIALKDPSRWFWEQTLATKHMRIKLAYDSLKQTYLLSNITLGRLNTDKDLKRALMTLGAIQSLPIIPTEKLQTHHTYQLSIRVTLERESLPNALRLSSLIDPAWRSDMDWQTQTWTYQP